MAIDGIEGSSQLELREGELEDAPKIRQSRSAEGPISCEKCPKRSVVFLREHTLLRRDPTRMTCPNCQRAVETLVERRNTPTTHLSALMLLPVCLCMLPYCSKILRDTTHRCPSCGIHLGAKFASARDAFVVCLSNSGDDSNVAFATNSVTEDSLF